MSNNYPKCYVKFAKSSLEKMKEMIKNSKSENKEHGSFLCMDRDRKINLGKICKGYECGIFLLGGNCEKGNIKTGTFHVHPHSIPPFTAEIPSSADWHSWVYNNHFLSCFGTEKEIKCFQKRRDFSSEEINDIKKIVNKMEFEEIRVDTEHPNTRQKALKRFIKYNKDLEKYYYKFSPEDCTE